MSSLASGGDVVVSGIDATASALASGAGGTELQAAIEIVVTEHSDTSRFIGGLLTRRRRDAVLRGRERRAAALLNELSIQS